MIAVTFALPDESRAFVAALGSRSTHKNVDGLLPVVSGELAGQKVMVIHTGIGEVSAYRRRLARLVAGTYPQIDKPRLLISSGYAGGLRAGGKVGDLILGANVSHADLLARAGEMLAGRPVHTGGLTTQNKMAETVEAKRSLAVQTGAVAVDMETGWIADVCAAAGVSMLSLRAISDAAGQPFPVPGDIMFDPRKQQPRYLALPLWLLAHPGHIGPFVRFVRGLGPARAKLTEALRIVVAGI